jgi:hypothetical protein
VTGYRFDLTCPYDGSALEHVADGRATGDTAQAVARCRSCSAEVLVTVTLIVLHPAARATPAKRAQLERARRRRRQKAVA